MSRKNKINAPQIISKDVLEQLYKDAEYFSTDTDNINLAELLRSIDSELTPPLRMHESDPVDMVLHIENMTVQNPETDIRRVIPPISNVIPVFTSGTVTFPTASGSNAVPSAGEALQINITSGNYLKVGSFLDANGELVLLAGDEGVSEAAATNPALISNTYPIGFVVLHNNAGTIQNIQNSAIFQYVGGGGGGAGTGDANSFLESLKNQLQDNVYSYMTPVIFSVDGEDFINESISTGEYSLVTSTFNMDNGEALASSNLLDSHFLSNPTNLDTVEVTVRFAKDKVDESASYYISRSGTVAEQQFYPEKISDEVFIGRHRFTPHAGITLFAQTGSDNQKQIGPEQRIAMEFELSNPAFISSFYLTVDKTGTPSGELFLALIKKDSVDDKPSIESKDILFLSDATDITALAASQDITVTPNLLLPAGKYYLALLTDGQYIKSYSSGTHQIAVKYLSSETGGFKYDGFKWVSDSLGYRHQIDGYELDLRVIVIASANDKALDGIGVFYKEEEK